MGEAQTAGTSVDQRVAQVDSTGLDWGVVGSLLLRSRSVYVVMRALSSRCVGSKGASLICYGQIKSSFQVETIHSSCFPVKIKSVLSV